MNAFARVCVRERLRERERERERVSERECVGQQWPQIVEQHISALLAVECARRLNCKKSRKQIDKK